MWPTEEPTRELLDQARGGDDDAVNRLLERHRRAVRQMVQARLDRAVSQRVDASDVVQDVMLEASQRLQAYLQNPVMPFHLWLRHLAKDRVIDMHRRHRVAGRRSVDKERRLTLKGAGDQSSIELNNWLCDPELTPATAALQRELQQRFFAALDELDERDREILVMRHFEHLTNQEVAQALDLSQPAAGMRYLRALRRLRAVLGLSQDGKQELEPDGG